MTTRLYLIRHGETEWNLQGRLQGHADSPLSQLGRQQAQWLAESLQDVRFDVLLSSSSGRTMETARIVRGLREQPIQAADIWREMHLGAWEGRLAEEIKLEQPESFGAFWSRQHEYKPDSGESYEALQERVLPALERLLEEHAGNTIGLFSHTVTLKIIMAHIEQRPLAELWNPPYFYPTCLSLVEWKEGRPRIVLHGDTSHFQNGEADGF